MKKKVLIAVVGPTAVGKTTIAIRLAQQFKSEIISADARQVFRELNIGTAKPTPTELATIKHHLINSHSIHEDFNAGSYALLGEDLIRQLFDRRDCAVLCGGSGLYIKALLHGFDDMPEVAEGVREQIISEYEKNGLEWLQQSVLAADPDFYYPADKMNPQRLMRALEVFRSSGKPFSSFKGESKKKLPYSVVKIGLALDRKELYSRIDQRMDAMIEEGLFEEARELYPFRHLNALQTVGYQEIFDFIDGKHNREEAIRLLKRNSRHYAKRQITWFSKDPEITWFNPRDYEKIVEHIKEKTSIL